MKQKKMDFKEIIGGLLERNGQLKIAEVIEESGLCTSASPKERKLIWRILKEMEEEGTVEVRGTTRSTVYVKKEKMTSVSSLDFIRSESAEKLLRVVSLPLKEREIVGYNQDFLRSYIPNESFYLSEKDRQGLLALGQVEHVIRAAGTYARNILDRLLIDLSWNSSRLEGNTYSLLETRHLIEVGESAKGKDLTETQMILNHKAAIEYVVDISSEKTISAQDVRSLHALLSDNLLGDSRASGKIRDIQVGIRGTSYLPIDNPYLIKEMFELFIQKINQIHDPYEQSFFALIHLSYLQAFEDINKRTARLVSNIPLAKNNLRPLSFVDVNQEHYVMALIGIYEKNDISLFRDLYIWAYQRSCQKYSSLQSSFGGPNQLKLKYNQIIKDIIRTIILEKITSSQVVKTIHLFLKDFEVQEEEREELFKLIEYEIDGLHDGNVARFKIRPSEYLEWRRHF